MITEKNRQTYLQVSVRQQTLTHWEGGREKTIYTVSTSKKGLGEQQGSEQTPRGWHYIRAKIGEGAPLNTVFVGRRPTGECYTPALKEAFPERTWVLTRILWLCGLEKGKNRGGCVDTMRRYVYIHGLPDDNPVGVPGSKGCICMRNKEIVTLFATVPAFTPVLIEA